MMAGRRRRLRKAEMVDRGFMGFFSWMGRGIPGGFGNPVMGNPRSRRNVTGFLKWRTNSDASAGMGDVQADVVEERLVPDWKLPAGTRGGDEDSNSPGLFHIRFGDLMMKGDVPRVRTIREPANMWLPLGCDISRG